MKEFTIYGLKQRFTEQYLYIGYTRTGSTKGVLTARSAFEDDVDIIGTNFEDISTDSHDEAIHLANLYRMFFGLLVSRNRMRFDRQIDLTSDHFDFELPALDPARAADRVLSRERRAGRNVKATTLAPLQKGMKRRPAKFVSKHTSNDVNGFVRYVPVLREGYPTLKCELINA